MLHALRQGEITIRQPPVLVMEVAENHASHNLAILGKGMLVVILHRWEYRGTFRNPRSESQIEGVLGCNE
jgi:hypothetical protein